MNLAKPTFALGLSGPAGIPRVPDPLGQDEARLHVDADALSYLEPESHFFHDIRTVVAATFEYQYPYLGLIITQTKGCTQPSTALPHRLTSATAFPGHGPPAPYHHGITLGVHGSTASMDLFTTDLHSTSNHYLNATGSTSTASQHCKASAAAFILPYQLASFKSVPFHVVENDRF